MEIKEILEAKIKDAGLTKKAVAERMGIASQNLNSMITAPSWPTLERLATALGMSIPELIRDPDAVSAEHPHPITPSVTCPKCGEVIPLEVSVKE